MQLTAVCGMKNLIRFVYNLRVVSCLQLPETLAVWLVSDFEVRTYQVKPNFDRMENLETCTATATNLIRATLL